MPNVPFPDRIDPFKLFNKNGHIESEVPLGAFKRLGEYLQDDEGQIAIILDFFKDDEGKRTIQGELNTKVALLCQRCLGKVSVPLKSKLNIIISTTKHADQESNQQGLDVIISDDDLLELKAIVEDELILSLPIVIYHDDASCNKKLNQVKQEAASKGLALDSEVKNELSALKDALKQKE